MPLQILRPQMRYLPIVLLFFCCALFAQRPTSFYEKLHQFNYPSNPLPQGCKVYGVNTNFKNRSIITKDYRGEELVLHNLKINPLGYHLGSSGFAPKLFSFSKYHKSEVPNDNGFLLKAVLDDVVLFHEYTGKDDVYEIKSTYQLHVSIIHKGAVHVEDTYTFNEVAGTFTSALRGQDAHIVATNKATEMAAGLNDAVLKNLVYVFNNFAKKTVDLSFTPSYIKFYGISKTKKLSVGEQIKSLEKRLKGLKKLDENVLDRKAFQTEVGALAKALEQFKEATDYAELMAFRFYVHANLASLHLLMENFDVAEAHYKVASENAEKERFQLLLKEERGKMAPRVQNKPLLFTPDFRFNSTYSEQYLTIKETRKRIIN